MGDAVAGNQADQVDILQRARPHQDWRGDFERLGCEAPDQTGGCGPAFRQRGGDVAAGFRRNLIVKGQCEIVELGCVLPCRASEGAEGGDRGAEKPFGLALLAAYGDLSEV